MKLEKGKLCIKNAEKEDCKQLVSWWNDGAVMAHAKWTWDKRRKGSKADRSRQ